LRCVGTHPQGLALSAQRVRQGLDQGEGAFAGRVDQPAISRALRQKPSGIEFEKVARLEAERAERKQEKQRGRDEAAYRTSAYEALANTIDVAAQLRREVAQLRQEVAELRQEVARKKDKKR
jgi:hypothetical protein